MELVTEGLRMTYRLPSSISDISDRTVHCCVNSEWSFLSDADKTSFWDHWVISVVDLVFYIHEHVEIAVALGESYYSAVWF